MIHTVKNNRISKYLFAIAFLLFVIFLVAQFVYILSLLLGLAGSIVFGISAALKALNVFVSLISTVSFTLFTLLIIVTQVSKNSNVKAIFFNVAFIFLAIGIFETYLQTEQIKNSAVVAMNAVKVNVPPGFWQKHDFMGTVPGKGKAFSIASHYNNELLYKVTYTIDADGLRISPPFNKKSDSESIVFFGCSVTFGYGLEDNEAFPYILGEKVKDHYKIYNFAFGGYGPHHMLSSLDHDLAKNVIDVKPKHVIFTAIPDHLRRIINNTSWGSYDPKYVSENGKAIYVGNFNDDQSVVSNIQKKIKSSLIFERFFKNRTERETIELFGNIVGTSKDRVKALYPDATFSVIFWDDITQNELCDRMVKSLENKGIKVIHILDILPDYRKNWSQYQIRYPMEPHPNYKANQYVADYIYQKIIQNQ